jgi:type IV pilus assembly protein PilV
MQMQRILMPKPQLSSRQTSHFEQGFTLIEVLIAMLVLSVGLLGLVGLQTRLVDSEIESYQRSQALLLLRDMADRLATNRTTTALGQYTAGAPVTSPVGAGSTCPSASSSSALSARDLRAWCLALQGQAETLSSAAVGTLTGGRGCIEQLGSSTRYQITVAWQGQMSLSAPPSSVACGKNSYDGSTGAACTADRCRRVVTTVVNIGALL